MAIITPFPATKRVGFIRRTARATVGYGANGAERFIETVVEKQRRQLELVGIEPFLAGLQIEELRLAILQERIRLLSRSEGAACR